MHRATVLRSHDAKAKPRRLIVTIRRIETVAMLRYHVDILDLVGSETIASPALR
jgi:hypothetical protein